MGFGTTPTVLEGDYSNWTLRWSKDQNADWGVNAQAELNRIISYTDQDKLLILFGDFGQVAFVVLSTGVLDTFVNPTITWANYAGIYNYTPTSFHRRYWAGVINDGTDAILKIFKDGSLIQSLNLTTLLGWSKTDVIGVAISETGKYIACQNYTLLSIIALFEGS